MNAMRRTPLKRQGKPRPVNRKRKAREFARAYGSTARVEFVKALPCANCGIVGYSQNAHTENGGAGRKGPYTSIIPLCGPHGFPGFIYEGCHARWDRHEIPTTLDREFAAQATAEHVEAAWQSSRSPEPEKESR